MNNFFETLLKRTTKSHSSESKDFLICSRCGNKKDSVHNRKDPYDLDVNNKITYKLLCNECYKDSAMSI